ncbi:MAG: hypothetical protein GY713_07040 [Actinomycetia bacterium]|nr:hypothetical protein [Actinomycetes bacterium]MCP3910692.1 hypothetical protein [Actinomycetes bacterium]
MANPLARLFGPALIISVLWTVLFWWPATGARSDAAAVRDAELTNLLEQQTELAIARREPVDEIELLAVLASSTAAVPEDANLAGVIDLLHETAAGRSVALTQVVPGRVITTVEDPNLPSGIGAIEVAIAATASFEDIMGFVDDLMATDRLLVLRGLDLISRDVGTGDTQANIEVRAYTSGIAVAEGEVGVDPSTLNRGGS